MMQRVFLSFMLLSVAACSAVNSPFGTDVISVEESKSAVPNAQQQQYAASIRLLPYSDGRNTGNAHKIGISNQRIFGISGTELIVEPEVSVIVTNSMKKRLEKAGFQLAEADAQFELNGVVKELSYDVKARDEISIAVESTLTELATGKVVWSGSVVEKGERFAGVSGDNKNDVANYLREKVGVVTAKTTESISAKLMASRPDLFNLTPGTRPIQGVTVLALPVADVAPVGHDVAPATAPVAGVGTLLVTSTPARAGIYVDEVYYGLTPLRFELAPGIHAVTAKLANYKTTTEKVSVRKGETTEIEMQLKK